MAGSKDKALADLQAVERRAIIENLPDHVCGLAVRGLLGLIYPATLRRLDKANLAPGKRFNVGME